MLLVIATYYWARLLTGVWFAFTNAMISVRNGSKKMFLPRFFVMFALSGTVVAIVTEIINSYVYNAFIVPGIQGLMTDYQIGIEVGFKFFCDSVAFILPVILFAKILGEKLQIAATVYFMYVIIDRLCINLAVDAVSYLIILVIVIIVAGLISRQDLNYVVEHTDLIEWGPVLHYQLGMFFLLEALYEAYYIFPGIENGVFDLHSLWLNSIAIISFIFFVRFSSLNIRNAKVQGEKLKYMEELQESEREIIQTLAEISEAKSGETGQHVRRVAEYSTLLAKEYGLSNEEVMQIKIASMMHDVGKLLVPREIIEKPGALSKEEYGIMQLHTNYGNDILSNSKGEVIAMARQIAYQHHERWDGKGYPDGISGDEISIYAQIVSVADVYDALTSRRSYKGPWDREKAKNEIIAQRGVQFAPAVVDVFVNCFDKIQEIQDTYID